MTELSFNNETVSEVVTSQYYDSAWSGVTSLRGGHSNNYGVIGYADANGEIHMVQFEHRGVRRGHQNASINYPANDLVIDSENQYNIASIYVTDEPRWVAVSSQSGVWVSKAGNTRALSGQSSKWENYEKIDSEYGMYEENSQHFDVTDNGNILIPTQSDKVVRMDDTGFVEWETPISVNTELSFTRKVGEYAYVIDNDGFLHQLNWKNGNLNWTVDIGFNPNICSHFVEGEDGNIWVAGHRKYEPITKINPETQQVTAYPIEVRRLSWAGGEDGDFFGWANNTAANRLQIFNLHGEAVSVVDGSGVQGRRGFILSDNLRFAPGSSYTRGSVRPKMCAIFTGPFVGTMKPYQSGQRETSTTSQIWVGSGAIQQYVNWTEHKNNPAEKVKIDANQAIGIKNRQRLYIQGVVPGGDT